MIDNLPTVVIFSHGLYASPHIYAVFAEEAASRGFLVLSPFHTDGSAFQVVYPSGKTISFKEIPLTRYGMQQRKIQLLERVKDIISVLDWLPELNLKIDYNRIYVVGHSYGGCTALQCFSMDKRFCAGVSLDGWFSPLDIAAVEPFPHPPKRKFMFLDSEVWQTDENRAEREKFIDYLIQFGRRDQFLLQVIPKTSHYSFCDLAVIVPRTGIWKERIPKGATATLRLIHSATLHFLLRNPKKQSKLKSFVKKLIEKIKE